MSHHKKHIAEKSGGFWEKVLYKKKPAANEELQEQKKDFRKILFEERRKELEEIKKHDEFKKVIEVKRQKRKEKIREMLNNTSILLQNLTVPKKAEITHGKAKKIIGQGKSFEECYANLYNAKKAIAKHDIPKAKNLYIEARNVYIDLSYEEKKEIYKELLQLYNQLAK